MLNICTHRLRTCAVNLTTIRRLDLRNIYKHTGKMIGDEATDSAELYKQAIARLDALTLNSTAQTAASSRPHRTDNTSVDSTRAFLLRAGLRLDELDALSCIHITGTKGKGTTCALTEAVLRQFGVRTGFFSSPHLIDVEERIRIDGRPLDRERFARYFFEVYNALEESSAPAQCGIEEAVDQRMPFYFQFLTVMAFYVFAKERVDCAIIEVGIGGEHDCTNVLRTTKTAACSPLGLEHTNMLGTTLPEIAWQKSGVVKRGGRLFSGAQPGECERVLRDRCDERSAEFVCVPEWEAYQWPPEMSTVMDKINPAVRLNGSLAMQLSWDWMRLNVDAMRKSGGSEPLNELYPNDIPHGELPNRMPLQVCPKIAQGLLRCWWPGRFHETRYKSLNLYIDGAHTIESLELCVKWFSEKTAASKPCRRYLIFNVTGKRDADEMLRVIAKGVEIDGAVFTPMAARDTVESSNSQLDDCSLLASRWNDVSASVDNRKTSALIFPSIESALNALDKSPDGQLDIPKHVLVTGSLYMVGALYELIGLVE